MWLVVAEMLRHSVRSSVVVSTPGVMVTMESWAEEAMKVLKYSNITLRMLACLTSY